jgi:TPR repeat protein
MRAGRRGDPNVFVNLGYAYDVGQGIRKSRRRALRWYRLAVSRGEAAAALNIGTVYRDRGDVIRSLKWFSRAVRMGHPGANLEVGQLLLARMGQPEQALRCFRAVSSDASDAEVEAARAWAARVEDMIATRESRGGPTRG